MFSKKMRLALLFAALSLGASGCGQIEMGIETQPPAGVAAEPNRTPVEGMGVMVKDPAATEVPPTETPTPTFAAGATRVSDVDGMLQVYVPEGTFLMGSAAGVTDVLLLEFPQHEVVLDAFWIDRTEVTNGMYALCVGAGVCDGPSSDGSETRSSYYGNSSYTDYPVIYVSWENAKAYCEWAGRRLPTEAEWEKAARGTDGAIYSWGNGALNGDLLNYCDAQCPLWSRDASMDDGYADTAPVGSYPMGASPYGALDMAGNVWEWVADWADGSYYATSPTNNPQGPASGEFRVLRGGSWDNEPNLQRAAIRDRLSPIDTHYSIGFRCALSP